LCGQDILIQINHDQSNVGLCETHTHHQVHR
jgi:hypothetical protein